MWTVLLTGSTRTRAIAHSQAIARALMDEPGTGESDVRLVAEEDASLESGLAGLAVSLAALAESGVAPAAASRASRFLGQSTETMASVEMDPFLFGGFSGVAWAYSRLATLSGAPDEDDELSEIDKELTDFLAESPWTRDYDLVGGLVGIGVYALERLPRPAARECLERIIDRLEETAECSDRGVTWFTPPALLNELELRSTPYGYYNLGLAHGVPGVVGLLGQLCAAGVGGRRSRALLDGAVAWLLGCDGDGDAPFPYWTGTGIGPIKTRLAWCYGDPGIAAALLVAARCVEEDAWERHALRIALRSVSRPAEDSGVVDSGLCHGAAGLAHVYNRIYQRTGDEELRSAAVSWLERTLETCRPGIGIAGYTTARKRLDGILVQEPDPSFLTGAAGVALALAAAATPIEPAWDRALLLSSRFEP